MPRAGSRTSRKSIYDPVHGTVTLSGAPLALVGEPAFQRLWGIRQTGFAHLVFPGANHTRLEHSLGVYWVARTMAERLDLDADAITTVACGGLLHDLGHPPFSHTFDPTLQEVFGYGHEAISRARILGEEPDAAAIPTTLERFGVDPQRVADLVDPQGRGRNPELLRSMLHGAVDADRIDYLQRDAHYTGVAHGAIDATRLLETTRVYRQRLAFAEKGRSALEGFLVGRSLMYTSVYFHKTVRAAELMAQAAVERMPGYPAAAAPHLRGTDGALLAALASVGGTSGALVQGVLARRLHKRMTGWKPEELGDRSAWTRLLRAPARRRAIEDELARRLKAPAASLLIDLSGLVPRTDPVSDFGTVLLVEDGRPTRPFGRRSSWRSIWARPPQPWAVNLYVAARFRGEARALRRAAARLVEG
ncbi:MAG: HD domain-containing protein [Thermoplasmata archaeon]|nr:HD domain-containing protein [Thermoplasmata archaeon]